VFEFGGERHRQVERGDPQRGGLEGGELLLDQAGDEFGAETVGAAALVQDDQPAGAGEGGADGVEPQRGERRRSKRSKPSSYSLSKYPAASSARCTISP
jgi:hypothetical protein